MVLYHYVGAMDNLEGHLPRQDPEEALSYSGGGRAGFFPEFYLPQGGKGQDPRRGPLCSLRSIRSWKVPDGYLHYQTAGRGTTDIGKKYDEGRETIL